MADWWTAFITGMVVGALLVAGLDEFAGWRKR